MFPTTSYIICTNPRSGSWPLSEGLAATLLAGNPREWLNVQQEQRHRAEWRMEHSTDLTYAAERMEAIANFRGLTSARLISTLFPEAKYLWLKRRDKARQAISLYIASSTNEWWAIAGLSPERPEDSTANPGFDPRAIARLERVLEQNEANWQSFFRENGITPLLIHYEDLASDYTGTITTVLKWLGIEDADAVAIPPPRLQRQSDLRSEEWLARYTAFKGDAGTVTEEPDESSNPLSEPIRQNLETIPSVWKQWVAQSKMTRTSDNVIVEVLVKNGYGRDVALAEVKKAASDPYLIGSARRQQRLNKAISLLSIQGQLARLDSRAVVERRSVLSRDEFRDRYYAANRPVVIQGLMTEWRATTAWTPDYLKSVAGEHTVEVMRARQIQAAPPLSAASLRRVGTCQGILSLHCPPTVMGTRYSTSLWARCH
jgi:trehalose 2-sulfotransferase